MCGIAGILYKDGAAERHDLGRDLITMLDGGGHRRPATEWDGPADRSHPFWATGFADVAIVHNGQITNYWKWRRRLEKRGMEVVTDNDSELIAVYLAGKMAHGVPLSEALGAPLRAPARAV